MRFKMIESILNMDTELLLNINSTISCFFFAFAGAFLQEILTIYKNVEYKISLHKILIGTLIGAILFVFIHTRYFSALKPLESSALNVFCGTIGFEIFIHTSSIDNLKDLANDIHQIIKNFFNLDELLSSKKDQRSKSDDDKDSESEKKDKK